VKKIVQGLTGKILPFLPKYSAPNIFLRVVREAFFAAPSLLCSFHRQSVIFLCPAVGVDAHTA
jgi:hypothetical protein